MRVILNFIIMFVICSSVFFIHPSFSAETTNIPNGNAAPESVTLSWEKFMQIWEKYRETDVKRSKDFAYGGALYEGRAIVEKNKYYLKFAATIHVTSYSDDKILVPVISAKLSPEKMLLDSTATGYIKKSDNYYVILQKKGTHIVQSSFTITLEKERWPRSFELPLVPIARSEIKLNVTDADIEATFEPGVVVDSTGSSDEVIGDKVHGIVPAVNSVAIRWLKRSQKREMIPLKMGAVVHSYVSLAENGANIKSEITFQILQGESHYFQIQVPNTIDILDVSSMEGDDKISQWYAQDTEKGRIVHIYTSYRHKNKFSVLVNCERTVSRTNYQFTLPRLVPQEVERYENLIAVGAEANVEISESVVERAEGRDVRFVPKEIQTFAKGRSLFYYKILDEDFNLSYDVKSHEKATVVKTRIERIEADSVVTEVGTVMTKATYQVKNNQAQFLKLKLPEGSKLLSAFTNGREVQPVMDLDTLLVPLDKLTTSSFPVEIAWLSKISSFGKVGRQSVFLPFSPVSIDELSWRLYTPEEYQMFYFDGNVERKSSSFSLGNSLGQGVARQVPLAYAGGGFSKSYKYLGSNVRERFEKGHSDEGTAEYLMRSSQVQVQIPVAGNSEHFSSYLIKGFTPKVSFYYMNSTLQQIVGGGYSLLAFLIVFSLLGVMFNRHEFNSYIPNIYCWLLGGGGVIFFGVLAGVFKLGVFDQVSKGILFAFILFVFWQNRQEARKFRQWASGKVIHVSTVVLIFLVFLVAFPVIIGEINIAAFFSVVFVLFQSVVFRLIKFFIMRRRMKKKEAVNIVAIVLSVMIVCPAMVWASGPVQTTQNSRDIISSQQQSQVKLAWPTIEQMLRTIEDREKRNAKDPKNGYLFGTVHIDGDITEKYASLRIDVPLRIISEQFIKIPLVSSDTPVDKVLYNNKPLALFRNASHIFFEAGKETDREGLLQIYLLAPVFEKGGVKEFMVHSPLLQGGDVELRFGTDIKSVKLFNVAWEKRQGGVIRAALGNDQHLRGELATFVRKNEADGEADKRVKKRYATTYTLVSLEDEIATYYSSIRYRILNEHVREFTIKLPQNVIVHEIVGEDLEGWRVEKAEDGMNTYIIKVMYPVADRYDLSVRYETTTPADEKPFNVPSLLVEGVARDTGYIGIEMQGRGEISIDKLEKARQIDIRELPTIIRTDADAPFVYAFRYIERPYNISFKIRKHKGLQMDPAIADRIDYTRVVSPQGTLLSQAQIWIRNSRKQYVTFQLPKGARLISTFLDGKSVKPSINDKGTLLLPLKRQSVPPFVLDVVFEDTPLTLNKYGSHIQLDYPQIDVPVSTVTSKIYIPDGVKVFEPGGDFQKTTRVDYVRWSSHKSANGLETGEPLELGQRPSQHQESFSENQARGTHSLKINIPKHGQEIALNAFYIPAGEILETNVFMIHQYLFNALYILAFVVCIIAGGFTKIYYRRPLFWCITLPLLTAFNYSIISSSAVILYGILSGYILLHILQWLKVKRAAV